MELKTSYVNGVRSEPLEANRADHNDVVNLRGCARGFCYHFCGVDMNCNCGKPLSRFEEKYKICNKCSDRESERELKTREFIHFHPKGRNDEQTQDNHDAR